MDLFLFIFVVENIPVYVYYSLFSISWINGLFELKKFFCFFRYREKAQKLSKLFRDQPQHPLEKALAYIDLLFKWGNTDHLRPASLDLTWYQLILLDVFAVIFLGLYIVYCVIRGIVSLFAKCLCGSSSKQPPKKGGQRPKKE